MGPRSYDVRTHVDSIYTNYINTFGRHFDLLIKVLTFKLQIISKVHVRRGSGKRLTVVGICTSVCGMLQM